MIEVSQSRLTEVGFFVIFLIRFWIGINVIWWIQDRILVFGKNIVRNLILTLSYFILILLILLTFTFTIRIFPLFRVFYFRVTVGVIAVVILFEEVSAS